MSLIHIEKNEILVILATGTLVTLQAIKTGARATEMACTSPVNDL
jgi:hypothetical protein